MPHQEERIEILGFLLDSILRTCHSCLELNRDVYNVFLGVVILGRLFAYYMSGIMQFLGFYS